MGKQSLHGLRNGQKLQITGRKGNIHNLTARTKLPDYVYVDDELGNAVARQAKEGSRAYRQAGTNPDYTGFMAYACDSYSPGNGWVAWSSTATKGEILRMLPRVLE